jgi:hypothetical protein
VTILTYGQGNSWNNLTPLYSTRADAEKLLGKPKQNKNNYCCEYETEKEKVSISYTTKKCEEGWDVPKDTILSITVMSSLNINKSFAELNLDNTKFSRSIDDALYGTWTDAEDGFRYYFSNIDRELIHINYIPKKSDNYLRCDGFPPYSPERQYFTMDTDLFYDSKFDKKESLFRIFWRADNLITNVMNDKENAKGYVLVYFDIKLPLKEYKLRLSKLRDHIFRKRKVSTEQITIIEGGLKETSEIEFYILPKEWKPPAPAPTIASPQFFKKH